MIQFFTNYHMWICWPALRAYQWRASFVHCACKVHLRTRDMCYNIDTNQICSNPNIKLIFRRRAVVFRELIIELITCFVVVLVPTKTTPWKIWEMRFRESQWYTDRPDCCSSFNNYSCRFLFSTLEKTVGAPYLVSVFLKSLIWLFFCDNIFFMFW